MRNRFEAQMTLAITAYNLHKIGRELLRQRRRQAQHQKVTWSITIPEVIHLSTIFMGEIHPDLAEMTKKVTVTRYSANLFHKIYHMDVN